MKSYLDLQIYKEAYRLAFKVHQISLKLPSYELYEEGSQIRISSKSIKDNIVEGYGRRRYKNDFIKFLIYAHASCDETISQLSMISELYSNLQIQPLLLEYFELSKKINNFIKYVEFSWR